MSVDVDSWRGVKSEEREEEPPVGIAALLRRRSRALLGSLLSPHKRPLVVAGVLILANTAAFLVHPLLVGSAIDSVKDGDTAGLLRVVLAIVAVYALEIGAWKGFLTVSGKIGEDILLDLRTRVFDKFQRLSLAFHEKYTSGRVVARLTSDVEALSELLATGLQTVLTSALLIFGIAAFMFSIDPILALIALVVFPVVIGMTLWFRKHSTRAYRAVRDSVALVIVFYNESLGGIRAVQAFRREPRNQQIFTGLNLRYRDANLWSQRLAGTYGPGIRFLGHISGAFVLLFGGFRVIGGALTLGSLVSFTIYLRRFFGPLQELSQFYNTFQAATAALEKLAGVLEEPEGVAEPDVPAQTDGFKGGVRFEHVTFSYKSDVDVLHDIHFAVPGGQTVALVGETGAGKTTMARMIARLYDPVEGRVSLDGIDLRDLADVDLRRAVTLVTQESFLFSGTVADNIAIGKPDASREEIEASAAAIGAHEFISSLPDGYDTNVKKRGGRLSAGQRQLVSFARAFLADPSVLILDEATSSLDIPTERLVQHALRTLLADRTAFIIAHRLTTVEIADRILVVHDGRVVEDGTPSELMGGTGEYAALHKQWLESLAT